MVVIDGANILTSNLKAGIQADAIAVNSVNQQTLFNQLRSQNVR